MAPHRSFGRQRRKNNSAEETPWWICAFIGVLIAIGLWGIFVSGPPARRLAQQASEEQMAAENSAFCERFGMRRSSPEYVECLIELDNLRRAHDQRRAQETLGVF